MFFSVLIFSFTGFFEETNFSQLSMFQIHKNTSLVFLAAAHLSLVRREFF